MKRVLLLVLVFAVIALDHYLGNDYKKMNVNIVIWVVHTIMWAATGVIIWMVISKKKKR
jgi:hypothetical protein